MRRNVLGILAIGFLAAGTACSFHPSLTDYANFGLLAMRAGLICGIAWLAWPDLRRLPEWLLFAVPIVVLVLVARPRYLLLLLPVLVVLAILKPRFGRRSR